MPQLQLSEQMGRREFLAAGTAAITSIGLPAKEFLAQEPEFQPRDPFNQDRPNYLKPHDTIVPRKPTEKELKESIERARQATARIVLYAGDQLVGIHSGFLAKLDRQQMRTPGLQDRFLITCAHGEPEAREIWKDLGKEEISKAKYDIRFQLPGMPQEVPVTEVMKLDADAMVLRVDAAKFPEGEHPGIPLRNEHKRMLAPGETIMIQGAKGPYLKGTNVVGTLAKPLRWFPEEGYRGHFFAAEGKVKSGMSGSAAISYPFAAAGILSGNAGGMIDIQKIGEAKQILRANGIYKKLQ